MPSTSVDASQPSTCAARIRDSPEQQHPDADRGQDQADQDARGCASRPTWSAGRSGRGRAGRRRPARVRSAVGAGARPAAAATPPRRGGAAARSTGAGSAAGRRAPAPGRRAASAPGGRPRGGRCRAARSAPAVAAAAAAASRRSSARTAASVAGGRGVRPVPARARRASRSCGDGVRSAARLDGPARSARGSPARRPSRRCESLGAASSRVAGVGGSRVSTVGATSWAGESSAARVVSSTARRSSAVPPVVGSSSRRSVGAPPGRCGSEVLMRAPRALAGVGRRRSTPLFRVTVLPAAPGRRAARPSRHDRS